MRIPISITLFSLFLFLFLLFLSPSTIQAEEQSVADDHNVVADEEVNQWLSEETESLLETGEDSRAETESLVDSHSEVDSLSEIESEADSESESDSSRRHHHRPAPGRRAAPPPARRQSLGGLLRGGLNKGIKNIGRQIGSAVNKIKNRIQGDAKKFGKSVTKGLKKIEKKLNKAVKKLEKKLRKANKNLSGKKLAKLLKKKVHKLEKKMIKKLKKLEKKAKKAAKKAAKKIAKKAKKAAKKAKKLAAKAAASVINALPPLPKAGLDAFTEPLDKHGRYLRRYHYPKNGKGHLLRLQQYNKQQKEANAIHEKRRALALNRVKQAFEQVARHTGNIQYLRKETVKSRAAAEQARGKAASAASALQRAEGAAKRGGVIAQKQLAAAKVANGKAVAAAHAAVAAYSAAQEKLKQEQLRLKEANDEGTKAQLNVYRNGFDIYLDKILKDLGKLDRALFNKKQAKLAMDKLKRKLKRQEKKKKREAKRAKARAEELKRELAPLGARPKNKLKVVYEGVDNSIAAQLARKKALNAVQEDIEDNAINGSISERHLIQGHEVEKLTKNVREAFHDHQDVLYYKRLIKPEHRFLD